MAAAPAAVLSDLDGTLSPVAAHPEDAVLVEGAADALAALALRVAVVGLITGRAAADARRIVGDPGILVAGSHGAEWLEPRAATAELVGGYEDVPRELGRVLGDVAARLAHRDGLAFEDKGISATIHYRNAPVPDRARAEIVGCLETAGLPDQVEVREGRMSVELRPRGVDKGTALRTIVERHGLRGVLLFGDDRTDVDAFRAARELREAGSLRAFIGAVGTGSEVPPEVFALADAAIPSPAALVQLLRRLA